MEGGGGGKEGGVGEEGDVVMFLRGRGWGGGVWGIGVWYGVCGIGFGEVGWGGDFWVLGDG